MRKTRDNWLLSISLVAFIAGLAVSMSWLNNENRSKILEHLDPKQRLRINLSGFKLSEEYRKALEDVKKLAAENEKLRTENTDFQNAVAKKNEVARLLNKSLQEMKMYAGLTQVEGPGILVVLNDYSNQRSNPSVYGKVNYEIIHDTDLLDVANMLWNAGAEAISINEQRIVQGTHFWCFGTTIRINGVQVSPPYYIHAIGDKNTLYGAVQLPGGRLNMISTLGHPDMVHVEKMTSIKLPAYSGATILKYAKLPESEKE